MKDDSLKLRQWQRQWIRKVQNIEGIIAVTENHHSAFRIYQNNFQQRLTESLALIYPALLTAMGREVFAKLVHAFSAVDQPKDPDLMLYGENMASFMSHQNGILNVFSGIARLEWFFHVSALAYECSYVISDSDPLISLGNVGEQAVYLEHVPRLLRTTTQSIAYVVLHHDVDVSSRNADGYNNKALFGICAINHPQGLRFLALSAGEYAFIRRLTHTDDTLEAALLWGLYSQPDGRFDLILDSFRSGGMIRICEAPN